MKWNSWRFVLPFCLVAAVGLTFLIDAIVGRHKAFKNPFGPGWKPPAEAVRSMAKTWTAGSTAPDFALPDMRTNALVRLSSFRHKKPVVLVLASFSCNHFGRQVLDLKRLYLTHKDRLQFLFVNVREAGHPFGLFNALYRGLVPEHDSLESRRRRACQAMDLVGMTMLAVMDGEDGRVSEAYGGFPRRLVVVDVHGRIALDAGVGIPIDWDLYKIDQWLKTNLEQPSLSLLPRGGLLLSRGSHAAISIFSKKG